MKKINGALQPVYRTNDQGQTHLIAQGFELEREQKAIEGNNEWQWNERVLILQSPSHASQQEKGLEQRLEKAQNKLLTLTPPKGRGQRQIREETALKTQVEQILTTHNVKGSWK